MPDFKQLLAKVASGAALSRDEAREAFDIVMSGEATPAQIGGFLIGLRVRGETVDEITGAVSTMRAKMLTVEAPENAIDIVGTGGDASGTYNISTCAAFVAAGAGAPIAKHGNRALSSKSGAADVLMALGVNLELDPAGISRCINEAGVGFMFAPSHHAAMKHVGPARVELATRTIFNLLGPLSNPAGVRRQMIGVFAEEWVEPLARVLGNLGSTHVWVVHGSDGLDEITNTGPTKVAELKDDEITTFTISPQDVGLPVSKSEDIKGGDAATNAAALRAVLEGERNAYRDVVAMNAGAALVVAGIASDFADGVSRAEASIDTGAAKAALERLVAVSNEA
ncbi:MAG: anthranilate phosphoribosyltransferase [Hyphomicrobiales bacterium]|nr:MAG: anthranilate phosphoribosyltransferase [Hyphomicrobiales bacterium]